MGQYVDVSPDNFEKWATITFNSLTINCNIGDIIIVVRNHNSGAASISNATLIGSVEQDGIAYLYKATSSSVVVTPNGFYTAVARLYN